MPYRIKIGDQQFQSDIEGTGEWSRSVSRDFNDRIFRTRPGYEFKGHEGLYNLLYNHITLEGVCEALEGRIYFNTGTSWDYEWKGDILPQDFQFDLLKRNVEAQVLDASWSAKINNSQDQKVFLRSTKSKNETGIDTCERTLCQFYDPSDAVLSNYLPGKRVCFRVYEVFKFLIRYYTDDTITFESDFFNTGEGFQYWITTGQEIREATGWVNPEISFNELFEEMNKKLNLWIIIEGTQDQPILRIEPQEYVFKDQLLLTVSDPENIKMKIDLDQLYTIVKVGSDAPEYDGTDKNYPTPRFEAWNNEEYNTPGDCEFENNTLDLVSTWKIDSNSIESQLAGNEDYDDDIFIVEIDGSPDYDAFKFTTQYTGSDTVEYVYNYNLMNPQVLEAWFDGIPQEIVKYIGDDYYVFVDTPTTKKNITSVTYDLNYQNDSTSPATDVDNIYTTKAEDVTKQGQFKSPGDLVFRVKGNVSVTNQDSAPDIDFLCPRIVIWEDDTESVVLRVIYINPDGSAATGSTVTFTPILPLTTVVMPIDLDMYIGADNVAKFDIFYNDVVRTGYELNTSYVELETTNREFPATTDNPLIYIYEAAQFGLSRSNFDILDQGRGFVRILDTNQNVKYDVWAKDVKYNSTTGVVEVGEFIGTTPPTQVCWVLETGYWNDECYWLDEEQLVESETDWFIFTVDTTVAAKTNNDQFELPLVGSANILVDWGDGQVETGVTSTTTHTYGSTGTYTIKVAGTWTRFAFLTTTEDNDKMQTIEQWGVIGWGSMANAFFHCGNLTANYTDSPNVSNCSNFQQAFRQCTNFNGNVGGFDMSSATSLVNMFFNCTSFNNGGSDSIKDWAFNSVSGNISLAGCFYGCTSFNQPLTNWATNRVTTFSQFLYNCSNFDQPLNHFRFDICTTVFWMLRDCTSFDQNVEDWNMDTRPVGTYTDIMRGDTLSTANYDALLVGWLGWSGGAPTKTLPSNRTGVNFGNSTYSLGSDADDARDYLINTLSWAITDGGGV